jgi:2-succinyl-5-enolpyruvyl-6-hydroxy-3-cyclohexene-1-carboxylate synthase
MREFILAVEEDPFFTCYCVTDERSAAYFAMGISQERNVPVAITCTSSTATTNYYPGITEAFHQNVPILILTGDRDPTLLGQQEDQMINQVNMYDRVVRKSVHLPIIKDESDTWYCERLINEAVLELDHRVKGPVHINVPVPALITWLDDEPEDYPAVRAIRRIVMHDEQAAEELSDAVTCLHRKKRILVLAGQSANPMDNKYLDAFFEKYNCVIHAEHMGNVCAEGRLNLAMLSEGISESDFDEYLPDLVISFSGTLGISRNMKEGFRKRKFEHWHICEEGTVLDAYKNLKTVFECRPISFFEYVTAHAPDEAQNNKEYYNQWLEKYNKINYANVPYSNVFAVQNFLKHMPSGCLLHLSILNSIRISHFFELPENTKVYANIGTDGIDGCMSTFLGQSVVSDRLSFLIIGDLSFFYDMSSIRIKHVKNNVRILLINNYGGNEFYQQEIMPTTDLGLGAKHRNQAKEWAQSVGFKYISAKNENEYAENLPLFVEKESDGPVLFEVFTEQMVDQHTVKEMKRSMRPLFDKNAALKGKVRSVIGDSGIRKIKKVLGKG